MQPLRQAAAALLLGMARGATLSLDGSDWSLRGAGTSADVQVPATVPGGVWDNLHRAGRVGDPLYRDNDLVYYNATTGAPTDWTLTKSFGCGREFLAEGAAALLEFEGIQTLATVSLNGKALLSADNMFRTYRVVLPEGRIRRVVISLGRGVAMKRPCDGPNSASAPLSVRRNVFRGDPNVATSPHVAHPHTGMMVGRVVGRRHRI